MQTNDESKLNQNKLTRFCKSQSFFLCGTGGLYGINCSLDEGSFTTPDLMGTLFVIATSIILAIPTKKKINQ